MQLPPFLQSRLTIVTIAYLALLALSHLWRPLSTPLQQKQLQFDPDLGIAYSDRGPPTTKPSSALILLHGSPVARSMFSTLLPQLEQHTRVITPDLPGYDASPAPIEDYSNLAYARRILALADRLGLASFHLVAYSQGGGIALHMADLAPQRVSSLVLLSAIGVQELELLGDYQLNRGLHGLQLGILWLLHQAIPHMGLLDRFPLNLTYARHFYESDQRPLRGILTHFEAPMLILHGRDDALVPVAAAKEHRRIVPQSRLQLYESGHGLVLERGAELADEIAAFVDQVEYRQVPDRTGAKPTRVQEAQTPFANIKTEPLPLLGLVALLAIIALSTLVSEDLACIGAGLLAARGTVDFLPATMACLVGIFVGDLMLYGAGRFLGRAWLDRPPLKWLVQPASIERAAHWFAAEGGKVILLTRFVPGTRLPTYLTAGFLAVNAWRFTFFFALAALLWTPLLVGLSAWAGQSLQEYLEAYNTYALPLLLGFVGAIWLFVSKIVPLFTYRGRRLSLSSWRRTTRWEFWPMAVFYFPLVFYILGLGFKHRSLSLFTAANPSFPAGGGFVGESKQEILNGLMGTPQQVAPFIALGADLSLKDKISKINSFVANLEQPFPLVLKPDVGERGAGVVVVRDPALLEESVAAFCGDLIAQEYIPGLEFGVFYIRLPQAEKGRIFSITAKHFPQVVGDGSSTIEELILKDDRAVCMAPLHLDRHHHQLFEVPADGEKFPLVELGTHSRGALFLDGNHHCTPALEEAIEQISSAYEGFYFGRYDIRVDSIESFEAGQNLKVVELNGVTSEATHIYDPSNTLFNAYRTLMEQWKLAFEIGAENRRRGVVPTPLKDLLHLVLNKGQA